MRLYEGKLFIGAVALGLLSSTTLFAQERPRLRERAEQNRETIQNTQGVAQPADRTIAECLGLGNQEEMALATLAAAKTKNEKVKQFAEMLVRDHGKFLSQLERFGAQKIDLARGPHGEPSGAIARGENAVRAGVAARDGTETRRTAANEPGLNFLDIKRQMAHKCLQNAQREWSEKAGVEADECFVGTQLVMHQQMLDAQQVLKQYASPELQRVIDEGIAATGSHLNQAKSLIKELAHHQAGAEPGAATRTSREAPRNE